MLNLSDIDVAILAGGLGTRLAPALNGKPKVLAEVEGHPFLEYLLDKLNKSGFKKIVLCTGHLAVQIEARIGKIYKNLDIFYSSEKDLLGSGGALIKALPLLKSKTILVMNGDSFCDVNFEKFRNFHTSKKSKATLVLSEVPGTGHFGAVKLGSDDNIVEFQEKKPGDEAGTASAGIYLIDKKSFAEFPQGKIISLEKDIFPKWVGKMLYGYVVKNEFIDIGTPENYKRAEQFFESYKL